MNKMNALRCEAICWATQLVGGTVETRTQLQGSLSHAAYIRSL